MMKNNMIIDDIKNDISELKNMINKFTINMITEDIEYGGFLDGDFNSNASKQSWGQFFLMMAVGGPLVAVGSEVSSWHGEGTPEEIDNVYSVIGATPKTKINQDWKRKTIKTGMKSKDFMSDVLEDESGEYINYNNGKQTIKLYLPNSEYYNNFQGAVYQFTTETGEKYQTILTLKSDSDVNKMLVGADVVNDPFSYSIKNANPESGNGWIFKPGPQELLYVPFFKVDGDKLIPFMAQVTDQSLKSSFQLFWEKWGVVIQIVGSIVLAYFSGGISLYLEGIVASLAEAEALAGGIGFFTQLSTWLAVEGSLGVKNALLLTEFVLELSINIPAGFIDTMYNNPLGLWLGITFSFMPFITRFKFLQPFIKGKYTKNVSQSLIQKMLSSGLNENSTQKQMMEFIINTCTPEERMMFAEGVKLLSSKEGGEAVKKTFEEVLKLGLKNKQLPSLFKSWLKTSGREMFANLTIGFGVFALTAGSMLVLKKLMAESGDDRSIDQVQKDSDEGVKEIIEKYKRIDSDKNLNTTPTEEMLNSIVNSKDGNGIKLYYEMSKTKKPTLNLLTLISDMKMSEIENQKAEGQLSSKIADDIASIQNIKDVNISTSKPKSEKDLNDLIIDDQNNSYVTLDVLLSDSNHPMNTELSILSSKFPCIKNFKYVDGDYIGQDEWFIKLNVTTKTKVNTENGKYEVLMPGETIYVYSNFDWLNRKNKIFKNFNCGL